MVMLTVILFLYFITLSILFLYAFHGFYLFLYKLRYNDKLSNQKNQVTDYFPKVTIQLPVYNEYNVVERLLKCIGNIKYPNGSLQIQILDDSTDETSELILKIIPELRSNGLNVDYIKRNNRRGYKAGALQNGLQTSKGEFIAIFDADFLPSPDFLLETIPIFVDDRIAMVQTRWKHINRLESLLTRVQSFYLDLHFGLEQNARNNAGFFLNFNGTAGVWRHSAIIDAGGWQSDTLTEDLDISYRAQLKGWKFIYLNNVTTEGELPQDAPSFKSQQFRWTKGAIQTALKLIPSIFKSHFPLKIKLESIEHISSNIVFPILLINSILQFPIIWIKSNYQEYSYLFDLSSVFIIGILIIIIIGSAAKYFTEGNWRKEIFMIPVYITCCMGLAINNSVAVFEGIIGKKSTFDRTPKYGDAHSQGKKIEYRNRKIQVSTIIEICLSIYFLLCIFYSIESADYSIIPFQLMFLFGYLWLPVLTLKHAFSKTIL
jgi:cellulose synthase/poly-beta-1,6-N-acetylglucosamine synthase-like glycosyltransferase